MSVLPDMPLAAKVAEAKERLPLPVLMERRGLAEHAKQRRGEIRDEADAILARIRTDLAKQAEGGKITLNRTQLTHSFAPNPGRHGAMTPARLYGEIIPDLVKRGLAIELPQIGKMHRYQFTLAD